MKAETVFDWGMAFSDHVQRIARMGELRREIVQIGLRCGSCSKWMKSRQCPREHNVNGHQRGPSMLDTKCSEFIMSASSQQLLDERTAELTALTKPLSPPPTPTP